MAYINTLHNILGIASADGNSNKHKRSSDRGIATGDLKNNISSRSIEHLQSESDGFCKRPADNNSQDGTDDDHHYTIGALSFGKPFDAILAELSAPTTTKAPEFAVSACTAAASLLSVSTGTSRASSAKPARPLLIRIESQELLPIRLSPSGSSTSLRSQSASCREKSSKDHRESTEKSAATCILQAQPTGVLKSILKKTRPVWTTRHQVHSHFGPILQYQHQELQEQQLREPYLPRQASLQEQQTVDGQQQQPRVLQQWGHGPSQLSQRHPHLRVIIPPVGKPQSLNRDRPLPTPPLTKNVRWAAYNEVLEIENIDELIMLGYYDDYDSDLGWSYRDQSQDRSLSETEEETEDDTDEEEEEEGEDVEDEDEDEVEGDHYDPMYSGHLGNAEGSDAGRSRQLVNYFDQVHHQSHHQIHQLQHYQQNHDPWVSSGYSYDTESVASTLDDESEIAEDDLIQRMDSLFSSAPSMPSFFPSSSSLLLNKHHQGLVQRFQLFGATSTLSGNGDTKYFPERPPCMPSLALPPRPQSPALLRPQSLVPSRPQCPALPRPQSPAVLAKAGERPLPPIPTTVPARSALPSRLKSPPPPYLSTMSLHLPPSLLHQRRNPQDLSDMTDMLSCQADKHNTEPKAGETIYSNTQSRSMNEAPRLDRNKTPAEVVERKRNSTGIFAWWANLRRTAATTAISGPDPGPDKRRWSSDSGSTAIGSSAGPKSDRDLFRADTISSISSSGSSSAPSTPSLSYSSTSSSPLPSPCTPAGPFSIKSAWLGIKPEVNTETEGWCASQYPLCAGNAFPRTAIYA